MAGTGFSNYLNSVAIQPDGKIVATGYVYSQSTLNDDIALVRFNANGTPDSSFGVSGILATDLGGSDQGNAIQVLADGSLLVAGVSDSNLAILHYTAQGALDPSFGTGGKVVTNFGDANATAIGLAVRPNGNIVVAGADRPDVHFQFDFMTAQFIGLVPDVLLGTAGNDTFTLVQDKDHQHIDWTLGTQTGQIPLGDPNGLTINGNGGNDVITLDYSNGNPLPSTLHLNGTFTINNLQGTNPLAGTTLDIGRSTVFLSYSSSDPIAAIQNYLANGYNSGAWNGTPTASTGVIISQAAQGNPNRNTAIGFADFADGQGVNTVPNTIELTYTLYGDANLDHQVNSADLQILLAFLNRSGAWDQGDFNYDGQVNSADLQSLLFTLNTSLGNQTAAATFAGAPAPMQNVQAQNKTVSPIPPNPTPAAAGSALSGPGHALRRIVRHRRR